MPKLVKGLSERFANLCLSSYLHYRNISTELCTAIIFKLLLSFLNAINYTYILCVCVCYRQMCLKYAELETKLGELERARTVFSHGSQMSDPRVTKSYWKAWQEFEVRHGNEDSFREMLRIKRSVQAQYNTHVSYYVLVYTINTFYEEMKVQNSQTIFLKFFSLKWVWLGLLTLSACCNKNIFIAAFVVLVDR